MASDTKGAEAPTRERTTAEERERLRYFGERDTIASIPGGRSVREIAIALLEERKALLDEIDRLRTAHAQGAGVLAKPLEWKESADALGGWHVYVGPYVCTVQGHWDDGDEYVITEWCVQWGEATEDRPLTEARGPCSSLEQGDEMCRAAIRKHLSESGLAVAPIDAVLARLRGLLRQRNCDAIEINIYEDEALVFVFPDSVHASEGESMDAALREAFPEWR